MITITVKNIEGCRNKIISIIEMLEVCDPNNSCELDFIKVLARELQKDIEDIKKTIKQIN